MEKFRSISPNRFYEVFFRGVEDNDYEGSISARFWDIISEIVEDAWDTGYSWADGSH